MGRVLGRGNASTEQILLTLFKTSAVTGWRRQLPLPGKPDFAFPRNRLVVFVDGCFWHSCPRHLRLPANNCEYWARKIERNRLRDRRHARALRERGWHVIRVWEHALRDPGSRKRTLARIMAALAQARRRAGGRRAG
jgi:DNA mismatch endonuclease (patch repair protein)